MDTPTNTRNNPAMKIATWNVNSIKARTPHVQRWITAHAPDVLFLQELKGEVFPSESFAGYHAAFIAQKAYNGVAILSKTPLKILLTRLPGDEGDDQARYLEAEHETGLRLINIYLPNGNPRPGDKYEYKLRWMDRLNGHIQTLRRAEIPFLIGGDFNVIPQDKDCFDPMLWMNDALYTLETHQKFRTLLNLGLTDAFRTLNQNAHQYTFWDYQAGCWQKDHGIRIDHFLLSPPLADRLISCAIDRAPRGEDSPSDHTPLVMELAA
jgi:exodeoxyribonuclease III